MNNIHYVKLHLKKYSLIWDFEQIASDLALRGVIPLFTLVS